MRTEESSVICFSWLVQPNLCSHSHFWTFSYSQNEYYKAHFNSWAQEKQLILRTSHLRTKWIIPLFAYYGNSSANSSQRFWHYSVILRVFYIVPLESRLCSKWLLEIHLLRTSYYTCLEQEINGKNMILCLPRSPWSIWGAIKHLSFSKTVVEEWKEAIWSETVKFSLQHI